MTQLHSIIYSTSSLSISTLSSRGVLGRPYSSRVYFRKLYHACRSTSMHRSALWLTFSPKYTNSLVWFYTWQAASTLNMAVDSGTPFVRKHKFLALASQTPRTRPRSRPFYFRVSTNLDNNADEHALVNEHAIKDVEPSSEIYYHDSRHLAERKEVARRLRRRVSFVLRQTLSLCK